MKALVVELGLSLDDQDVLAAAPRVAIRPAARRLAVEIGVRQVGVAQVDAGHGTVVAPAALQADQGRVRQGGAA